MNTRNKRTTLRKLSAAFLTLMLLGATVAVSATAAGAANTSKEVLTDDGNRAFAGTDRFDTALRLAENFADAKGGLGSVPVAFVASGFTLVDAVAVAGLAGFLDAPVLLTNSTSLHGGVADFIEDYGVDTVHVLGGSAAIDDSVFDALASLDNEPTVDRFAGANRYDTAVKIAEELGVGSAWCDGDTAAAIVVNGGDVSLADAMLVAPIAYRLQVPILLTEADSLPVETADFLTSEDIEHVVIVGGESVVSENVATALDRAGVSTVDRVSGDSAAATSVALAELALGDCADALAPVSTDTVALVNADALPDGIVSAPVLAGYAEGALVPVLAVDDTLPASVRDYLAETPEENETGHKVELKIVAIGGTAVVSQAVMDAALAASASAEALTVKIGASEDKNGDGVTDANDAVAEGDTSVTLYFSDDVVADAATLTNVIRDIIEKNGVPARLGTTDPVEHVGAADACNPDQVKITFAQALEAGDVISIAAGTKLGANADTRTLNGASVTVPATPADRTRPTIDVIMLAGRSTAEVTVSEDDGQLATDAEVTIRSASATKTVTVGGDGDLDFNEPLVAGDRVTIAAGAIVDTAGNKSAQRTYTAVAPPKSPRITSVLLSSEKHSAQASTTVPDDIAGSGSDVTIRAKADGNAAGAVGNGWNLVFDVVSTWDAEEDVDIDVRVNTRGKIVSVRFVDGTAKFGDLKDALEGNSTFDALFEVELPANAEGGCGATLNEELTLDVADRQIESVATEGGESKVAIEVRFNGYVQTVNHDELLDDILAQVVKRTEAADDAAARTALGLNSLTAVTGPERTVRYEVTTTAANQLPQVRDLVVTAAGRDADDTVTPAVTAITPVATGYAADNAATAVKEDMNAASQVRIGRSSNVKAPAAS